MAAKPISKFFDQLGFRLRNIRWSWGARRGDSILLRTWQDEQDFRARTVTVLREPAAHLETESFGLDERIVQLKALWNGEAGGYTVIVEVKDKNVRPREIKGYREDVVFAIKRLQARADGGIVAVLGEMVPVAGLQDHSKTHRTEPAEGIFPVDDSERSGLSTDGYAQKLPAMRAWLISLCASRSKVTYAEVRDRFGLTYFPLINAMNRLGHDCQSAGEPIITALIVDKDSGTCSGGLEGEFGIVDDQAERERCYDYWGLRAKSPEANNGTDPEPLQDGISNDFEDRVRRFSQVEVRTQQAAFRAAVFRAFGGRCIVSGCDVPEALEAAHLLGRDWHEGHNQSEDGLLLRRDLHTLYDRGLLRITDAGIVEFDARVVSHYGQFVGAKVTQRVEAGQ